MTLRGTTVSRTFDAVKKANPGMSDTEAMSQAIGLGVARREREIKIEKKVRRKRKPSKVRMSVTGTLPEKFHSPAGLKHIRRKRAGV